MEQIIEKLLRVECIETEVYLLKSFIEDDDKQMARQCYYKLIGMLTMAKDLKYVVTDLSAYRLHKLLLENYKMEEKEV